MQYALHELISVAYLFVTQDSLSLTENSVYEISQAKKNHATEAGMYEVPVHESESQPTKSTRDYGTLEPNKQNLMVIFIYYTWLKNYFYWAHK